MCSLCCYVVLTCSVLFCFTIISLKKRERVYISQLIRFARVCSNIHDFNNSNNFLTSKLLSFFSKFYYRNSDLIVKYNICLRTLLKQGI